jgi:hypothetical protein
VRLEITPLWGLVTGSVGNPLTLNLGAIDGRNPSLFNFAGTGATAATDANAGAYLVNTGSLDLSSVAVGSPARVFGFVAPFGSATTADFNAQTLVSYSQVTNQLLLDWSGGGSTMAFPGLMANSTELDLDLDGAGLVHYIRTGPQKVSLLSLDAPPSIVGDTSATFTAYVIGYAHGHRVGNYQAFADFITALSADLANSPKVLGVAASGHYDSTGNVFTAAQLAVLLND